MNQVIRASTKWDHETWNDCPQCGFCWKDPKPTPGIIHRTRLCARHQRKADERRPKRNPVH